MGPLRIALMAPLWHPVPPPDYGGIERMVFLLSEELVRRGERVTLFASGDSMVSAELRAVCPVNVGEMMKRGQAYEYDCYANAQNVQAILGLKMGSVPEVVDCGKTGFYADTIEELAALIPQAAALDRKMVRAHAMERFSHRRVTDQYLELYRSLMAIPRGVASTR